MIGIAQVLTRRKRAAPYDELRKPHGQVAATDWFAIVFTPQEDGLAALFTRKAAVPPERLQQIRAVMRKLLLDDTSDRLDGPTGSWGKAAERLIAADKGIDVVVMGHTHLPRKTKVGERGTYLNTGTWVDRFRVPAKALVESADKAVQRRADMDLEEFLRALWKNERSPLPPTYGELRVDAEGRVTQAEVHEVEA